MCIIGGKEYKKRMRSLAPLLVIIVCSAQLAFGSAFAINELGGRAQGMGGAFTAVADDPTAIFFNPAGIAYLKGMQVSMDMLIVAGQFRFIPSDALRVRWFRRRDSPAVSARPLSRWPISASLRT